ncbi:MAG: histidine phosphatase family protein [Candidatus Limnocylindrales bacterium]
MSEATAERQVWLVRHGETEWSIGGRHTGRTDVPLTADGRAQARALGARVAHRKFSLILTSPLARATDTARLAGHGEDALADPDLVEWDYGTLEGMTTPEIRQTYPGWTVWDGPWPEGETPAQVGVRVDRVIERCLAPNVTGDVLLFGHGHLLRVLTARWLGLPPDTGRLFALSTATVGVLGWEREHPVIESWNVACHLE